MGQVKVGHSEEAPEIIDDNDETPDLIDTDDEDDHDCINPNSLENPKPKWKAMLYISVGRRRIAALADSGCTGSCISYDYFVKNPSFKQSFTPLKSCGRAINGTDVSSIGEVTLKFWIEGVQMSIRCKVIKGLVDPIVLGWDWMSKYGTTLDEGNDAPHFSGGNST